MTIDTLIEIVATVTGLLYVILMVREKVACWPFGIVASALSIILFVDNKLYSEALLFSYYVAMGVWGWLHWHRRELSDNNPVLRYGLRQHVLIIGLSALFAFALGSFFANFSDAERPYVDACTTAFSFAATYMQVKKVLENWLYWVVINSVSIWLYMDRSLDIYALLVWVYVALSFWGMMQWLKIYRRQLSPQPAVS